MMDTDLTIFQVQLILVGGVAAILLLAKVAKEPKFALYLMVLTAPITQSLGGNIFLRRFTISEFMGILFIAFWLGQALLLRKGPERRSTPLDPFIGLLVGVWGVSMLLNGGHYRDILFGLSEFSVLLYLAIFYVVFTWSVITDDDVRRILNLWLLAAVFVVGIGLWDSFGNRMFGLPAIGSIHGDGIRVYATFRTTGQLGNYLLTTFFVALACLYMPGNSKRRQIAISLLLIGVILLALFASRRSTYFAFLGGLAAFALLQSYRPKVMFPAVIVVLIGFWAVTGFLEADQDFAQYFDRRINVLDPEIAQEAGIIGYQLEGIRIAFTENPIIGIGPGRYYRSEYDFTSNEIHSAYGQVVAETGVIGIIAYVLFMITVAKMAFDVAFWMRDPRWHTFAAIIFAAFFGFSISYAYNRHLRERTFWILVGVLGSIHRLARERTRELSQVQGTETRPGALPRDPQPLGLGMRR